jgi:hypothetical protein
MMSSLTTSSRKPREQPCQFCRGAGEVSGIVDDVKFTFECPCSGGSEEALRWLLGREWEAPEGEDWMI